MASKFVSFVLNLINTILSVAFILSISEGQKHTESLQYFGYLIHSDAAWYVCFLHFKRRKHFPLTVTIFRSHSAKFTISSSNHSLIQWFYIRRQWWIVIIVSSRLQVPGNQESRRLSLIEVASMIFLQISVMLLNFKGRT